MQKKVGKLQLFKNRNKNENKLLENGNSWYVGLESIVMFKVTKCARDEVRGFLLVNYKQEIKNVSIAIKFPILFSFITIIKNFKLKENLAFEIRAINNFW